LGCRDRRGCLRAVGDVVANEVGASHVTSIAFSSDGTLLAAGYWNSRIIIWNAETGTISAGPLASGSTVHSVAFSSNNRYIVSGSTNGAVRIWDIETCDTISEFNGH
jgi:WD40 repeat protein